jgi:hypothetical protein
MLTSLHCHQTFLDSENDEEEDEAGPAQPAEKAAPKPKSRQGRNAGNKGAAALPAANRSPPGAGKPSGDGDGEIVTSGDEEDLKEVPRVKEEDRRVVPKPSAGQRSRPVLNGNGGREDSEDDEDAQYRHIQGTQSTSFSVSDISQVSRWVAIGPGTGGDRGQQKDGFHPREPLMLLALARVDQLLNTGHSTGGSGARAPASHGEQLQRERRAWAGVVTTGHRRVVPGRRRVWDIGVHHRRAAPTTKWCP